MERYESLREQHNQLQRDYYENRKSRENYRLAVGPTPYVTNHIDKFLDFSNMTRDQAILDIGCGMGKYTIPMAERGFKVEGMDLSPKLLEELRHQAEGGEHIKTYCSDILRPNSALLGRFDHVTGFFMLHHLVDLDEAFRQCARLLRPGGRVTFLEPNPYCLLFYIQITLSPTMSWKAERGILNLTPKKVARSLEDAGFMDVRLRRFGTLPPLLRNRKVGERFEHAFDRIDFFEPISAFQLISAKLEDAA